MAEQAVIGAVMVAVIAVGVSRGDRWVARRASDSGAGGASLLAVLGIATLVAAGVLLIAGVLSDDAPAALEEAAAEADGEEGGGDERSSEDGDDEDVVDPDSGDDITIAPDYFPAVFDPEDPPLGFPELDVSSSDGMQPGTVLFTTFTSPRAGPEDPYHPSFLTRIDKETGDIVSARQVLTSTWIFRPEPDGRYSYNIVDKRGTDGAGFESTTYVVDDQLAPVAGYNLEGLENGDADPHDHRLLDNGNMLLMSYRAREVDLSDLGGKEDGRVYDTVIAERTPEGETVWTWDSADHLDLADVTEPVAEAQYSREGIADHTHPNSIATFPDGDVLVSIRHYDCIYRIDRPSSEVVWTLGGENCAQNDFEIRNDPHNGFSHQHDATVLDNGNILLFDNANLREDPVSRVVEYELDEEAMTAELVWSHEDGRYTPIMGSAQRLDNGNTLVGWGSLNEPAISEVTRDGEEVFSVSVPPSQLVYRAYQGEPADGS